MSAPPKSLGAASIPFNRPSFVGKEEEYLKQVVQNGHLSGDGSFTKRCHEMLERGLGVPKALLTTSCTHALEMCALLLDLQPGDEVVVPTFTFVSTINAFVLRGATPVFADIRPDTLNLDESRLDDLMTPRTRVVVPVHYAGVGCEMDAIMAIAEHRHVATVEDNAHAMFGRYRGRNLGTFAALATQSFHETKNFSCGEGGALLINDVQLIERAEIIREKGTNRSRFFRGQVDKYSWVDVGSSYLPSELLAAVLAAQLEQRHTIQSARQQLWERYDRELASWADARDVRRPFVPAHCDQPYHMYYLLFSTLERRSSFISYLRERGITSVFHYLPLHLSEMGRRFGGRPGDCPTGEAISDQIARLPFFTAMTESEQTRVIEAVLGFSG
jgi:dTDP-4-amino-4,6-dideoxygalactose transaminase